MIVMVLWIKIYVIDNCIYVMLNNTKLECIDH